MSDFSQQGEPPVPIVVHTLGTHSSGHDVMQLVTTSITNFSWPAQNRGLYIPVSLPWAYPVARVFWVNGSTPTGNMCFAIFNKDFVRLYTTGAVAQSGASSVQYVDPTDFLLPAGPYYFFLSNDSVTTTNRAFGDASTTAAAGRMGGLLQQASVATAPEKGAPEEWASAGLPLCGITRVASGL